MYQLNLLLFHVEPQARAKHNFDLPRPTYLFSCLVAVFTMSTFWEIYLL